MHRLRCDIFSYAIGGKRKQTIGSEDKKNEKNVSTQEKTEKQRARIQKKNGNGQRKKSVEKTPCERQKGTDRVNGTALKCRKYTA